MRTEYMVAMLCEEPMEGAPSGKVQRWRMKPDVYTDEDAARAAADHIADGGVYQQVCVVKFVTTTRVTPSYLACRTPIGGMYELPCSTAARDHFKADLEATLAAKQQEAEIPY